MGYNITSKSKNILHIMKSHPNYKPLVPNKDETLIEFTLRWAGHLVSPPQEPNESYTLECVDIRDAIFLLTPDIKKAWDKHQNGLI